MFKTAIQFDVDSLAHHAEMLGQHRAAARRWAYAFEMEGFPHQKEFYRDAMRHVRHERKRVKQLRERITKNEY